MTNMYTVNTRTMYRAGAYAGTHSIGELRHHGDFGLGALDQNDGEFVMLDGQAHRTDQDGTTTELDETATTPYAAVLPFQPTPLDSLPTSGDKAELENQLAGDLPTTSCGWAVRIEVQSNQLHLRSRLPTRISRCKAERW